MNVDETPLRWKAKQETESEKAHKKDKILMCEHRAITTKTAVVWLLHRSPPGTTIQQTTTQTDQHNTMTY